MSESTKIQMSDGCNLFVKVIGNPHNPLFIVHHSALGAANHVESELYYGFLATRFRLLVFDARGCGDSDLQRPFTHDRWVADIEELRQWAGVEKFYLAGNSYGAFISLQYAVKHSNRLLGLVLRAAVADGDYMKQNAILHVSQTDKCSPDIDRQKRLWSGTLHDNEDFQAALMDMAPLFDLPSSIQQKSSLEVDRPEKIAGRSIENEAAVSMEENWKEKEILPATLPVETDPQLQQRPAPALIFETHNAAFGDNMLHFNVVERLSDIRARTLIVVGRYDWLTPVEASELIHAGIPDSTLAIFERSTHNPPAQEPAAFMESVHRWLDLEES